MHFRIDADPPGPLATLRQLPPARLAVLEGLNGIGKTLALRILQLCTGVVPYRLDSAAWGSLRSGLGEFSVDVADLAGGQRLHWRAQSRSWPDEGEVDESWFEELEIDGRPASMAEVRGLLAVHRLAGDEGVHETFAADAEEFADAVSRWWRRVEPLYLALDAAADEALGALSEWTPHRYAMVVSTREEARSSLQAAEAELDSELARSASLQQAAALGSKLALIKSAGNELGPKLQAVEADLAAHTAEKAALQARMDQLTAKLTVAGPLLTTLKRKRATLRRNRSSLEAARIHASAAAAPLGIRPDPQALVEARAVARARHQQLLAERTELDAAPYMRKALGELAAGLAESEARGLADQVAVDLPTAGVQLTVAETRAGMLQRREWLGGQPTPPQAEQAQRDLENAKRELRHLDALEESLEQVATYTRRVRNNEKDISELLEATQGAGADALQQMEEQRRVLDERLLELATERAALRQRQTAVADVDPAALRAQFAGLLSDVGIEAAQLASELDRDSIRVGEAKLRVTAARQRVQRITAEISRAHADLGRVAQRLRADPQWEWFTAAAPLGLLDALDGSTEQQLAAIERSRSAIRIIQDRLSNMRNHTSAVDSALRDIAATLRGKNMDLSKRLFVPAVRAWLDDRFSAWFSDEAIRRELLPRANGPIRVLLEQREVSWTEGHVHYSRPLEAFSSGEQAFAYTRARLAILDSAEPRPPNRFIALDEFGAFLAAERRNVLLQYLNGHVQSHTGDQVLILLPAGNDYERLARESAGEQATEYRQRADSIAAHGYTVQTVLT